MSSDSTFEANLVREAVSFKPLGSEREFTLGLAVVRINRKTTSSARRIANSNRGGLELRTTDFTEVLFTDEQGVHQEWQFPQVSGVIEVTMPLRAGTYVGVSPMGLHFQTGQRFVRYSHATWVDADGNKTAVPARFESGSIVLRVPQSVVAASRFPAVLDPVLSPEFGVDQPVLAPSNFSQKPAIASDGTNSLVVWQDSRFGQWSIVGARVDANGAVIDGAGFGVSLAPGNQWAPRVVWAGTHYVVVWEDERNGNRDVYAARVGADGRVLDPNGIAVTTSAATQTKVALAVLGTNVLVVWQDALGNRVRGARLDPSGLVLDSTALDLSPGLATEVSPALAWDGTNALVVWQAGSAIQGTRVSTSGIALDPMALSFSSTSSTQGAPALAWNGTHHLLAWNDTRGSVYAERIDALGGVLDSASFQVCSGFGPRVVWNGSSFLVTAVEGDVWASFVAPSGTVQPLQTLTSSYADNLDVVWNGTAHVIAYERVLWGIVSPLVHLVQLDANGAASALPGPRVSSTSNLQMRPSIASDGTNYLVAWEDYRSGSSPPQVLAMHLDAKGQPIDPAGLVVTTGGQFPHVAWNGTSYFVAWYSPNAVLGVRVSATGARVDAAPITVTPNGSFIFSIEGADGFLVAWSRAAAGVQAARISNQGVVLDTTPLQLANTPAMHPSAVGSDGSDYLVAWSTQSGDLLGHRVSATTGALGTMFTIAGTPGYAVNPTISWNGSDYFVAWSDDRRGAFGDLYGARVSAQGTVRDPSGIPLHDCAENCGYPASAWSGAETALIWTDLHQNSFFTLGAGRFDTSGNELEPAWQLAFPDRTEDGPDLACATRGHRCLAVWSGISNAPGQLGTRISGRFMTMGAAPTANAQQLVVDEDSTLAVNLTGQDADGDALDFALVGLPSHGVVSGTPPALTYAPAPDFHGDDTLTFRVSDGAQDSTLATIAFAVRPVNDLPVADAQQLTTLEDTPLIITLTGADLESSPLAFSIVTAPAHGVLTGTGPTRTYTPTTDFAGADQFEFRVFDGDDGASAVISITVLPSNDAPVALEDDVVARVGIPRQITLRGTDADGDALDFTISTPPQHGRVVGVAPNVRFTLPPGVSADEFWFTVSDGALTSPPARVTIHSIVVPIANVTEAPTPVASSCSSTGVELLPALLLLAFARRKRAALYSLAVPQ